MDLHYVTTLRGMPEPADVFQPHMPDVAVLSDMNAFFATVRQMVATGHPAQAQPVGQYWIALVPPDREFHLLPCPPPNSMSQDAIDRIQALLPAEGPLNIAVVSYTYMKAIRQDTDQTKCIPFLGYLRAFGYLGHNVLIFEGHPSAFASGIRNSDVLVVDSGMEPFLVENWREVAFAVMRPNPLILIHNRQTYALEQIRRVTDPAPEQDRPHPKQSFREKLSKW